MFVHIPVRMSDLGSTQRSEQELQVPLLGLQPDNEIHSDTGQDAGSLNGEGDVEQGLVGSDAEGSNKSEEEGAIDAAARASCQSGPLVYIADMLRLAIFYWAIVADALLLKELYSQQYLVFAGIATGFTVGPHVFMSLLLIIRQGWLQAASQACGFILTLNPFESLTPIPQGILGLFVISIGFIAYVLIAASGLIFVAYCVVCYLVTALLFSLLILDLAALVITVAPSKAIFKYTDLVYTENFKFSRLVLQAWLQSAPELVLIGIILYRNMSSDGPAVVINGTILLQALAAHTLNLWDKSLLFRSGAAFSGAGAWRHLLALLQVKGSCRLSLPVLRDNLNRVLRGTGGAGAGLGSVVHISSAEDPPDNDSEAAASMVPEYLTPTNGGLLSPGQLMALARAVFGRYGGPGVAELVLEVTPDVMVGKLLSEIVASVPNTSSVRLVNASLRGRDASMLSAALLQCSSLRTLQLHQVIVDERGAAALTHLLEHTPTLQQLELCRCKLRRKAPQTLAHGLHVNKTLRQLNLAGSKGLSEAGASALAGAVAGSKVLCALNLAFVNLGMGAIDNLVQAINSSSSLRVLAISQSQVPAEGAKKLLAAIAALRVPKAPPSLSCNLTLGTFPVEGLDKVQWLAVQDQDALIMDAWQSLAGPSGVEEGGWGLGDGPGCGSAGPGNGAGGSGGSSGIDAANVAGGLQLAGAAGRGGRGSGTGAEGAAAAAAAGAEEAAAEGESAPLLGGSSSSSARAGGGSRWQHPGHVVVPHPASAFGVSSPIPIPAAAGSTGGVAAGLLPSAAAAWFSSSGDGAAAAADAAATTSSQTTPQTCSTGGTNSGGISSSCSNGSTNGSSSSRAAAAAAAATPGSSSSPSSDLACPTLVFVVTQDEVVNCMVRAPLLFQELDTLDLSGLGVGDEGAAGMAAVLEQDPVVRRVVLADNKIGEEGGAALAAVLTINTTLQVLDLSANELSETGVAVLADATRSAAGLHQLRLLGNKIPFGLQTLRHLMEAEAAAPHCHLVLVEDPAEVLDELEKEGDAQQAARAADFFKRQEQYRQQRRQRQQQRQQRLLRLEEQAAATAEAGGAAGVDGSGGAAVAGAEASCSAHDGVAGDIEAPAPPPPDAAAAAAAAEVVVEQRGQPDSSAGSGSQQAEAGEVFWPASPHAGSGSLSSITTDEDTCGVCFDNNNHVAIKYCGHRLCVDCYRKVWELSGTASTCPFCRARLEGYLYLDWPLET